jgi:hypothetical protein
MRATTTMMHGEGIRGGGIQRCEGFELWMRGISKKREGWFNDVRGGIRKGDLKSGEEEFKVAVGRIRGSGIRRCRGLEMQTRGISLYSCISLHL